MHVAVIMDGNGRWAKEHHYLRLYGHNQGTKSARACVKSAIKNKVKVLTLFAFSSENWKRPKDEVSGLMELFFKAIKKNEKLFHKHKIRFHSIGDRTQFSESLSNLISKLEESTKIYTGLHLVIAANYGGRWDINNAHNLANRANSKDIEPYLALNRLDLPQSEVDLLIRTGSEKRVSNFLLWHLAYSELYFSNIWWPDFTEKDFNEALSFFKTRNRRFGKV